MAKSDYFGRPLKHTSIILCCPISLLTVLCLSLPHSLFWKEKNGRILYLIFALIVHSHSVDSRKLCSVCVATNYTPLSMAYYAYGSAIPQNLQYLYAYQKNCTVKRSYVVLEILNGSYSNFSVGQLNVNRL